MTLTAAPAPAPPHLRVVKTAPGSTSSEPSAPSPTSSSPSGTTPRASTWRTRPDV